jgi:RNA polymerase subunit RPABC4/transcription elongation factor Spt4
MSPPMNESSSTRAETAAKIVSNPGNYKVCEGCDSIVGKATAICPNCHSFRFDSEHDSVVHQAVILGSREQRSVTAEDLA